nr:MAG TPA: hypothetical protein [Caudoviricetes sp.]
MTRQEREEMFAKDFLVAEDLMKLCGCCRSDASQLIQEIKRKSADRFHKQGRIHVQDYIEAMQLDTSRYYGAVGEVIIAKMEPLPKAENEEEIQAPKEEESPAVERKPLYNVVVINGERMKVYRGEG